MLKLAVKVETGMRFSLQEIWQNKLAEFNMMPIFPYNFEVKDIYKQGRKTYYICESENTTSDKKIKLAITKDVARYIFAEELPDINTGLYFKDYFPEVGSKLLITNERQPSEVVPVVLELEPGLVAIKEESVTLLQFRFNFVIGKGFTDSSYYSGVTKKYTWKFVELDDESYMTDYEKMFKDTVIHKSYLKESVEKLAKYLEENNAIEHANLLRQRAEVHDNSKVTCADELDSLSRLINDKSTLKDPDKQLSSIRKEALVIHWEHNSHHPEHFKSVIDMTRLDIMEMCCDWHARSLQYGTDFLYFVKKQNEIRFHFPDWMFAEIIHYCEILNSKT